MKVMELEEIEDTYKSMGLVTQRQSDKPGSVYKPHRHAEARIYTIKGSAKVRLDNKDWQTVGPGDETVIHDNQLHEATAGPEGWEYIFATSPEEAKRQGIPMPTRSMLSVIGLILAFIIPTVGAIVSIFALREIKQKSLSGKGLAIAGIILGVLLTLPFLFFVWLFIMLGGLHGNGAQSASKPLIAQIEQAGGKKLCDNGDSGYGIDNSTPWYNAYYQIPDNPGLTTKIKSFASQDGYVLQTDREGIKQLKDNASEDFTRDQEQYSPESDYLTGHNGDKTLSVTIYRDTSISLYCSGGKWGLKQATGNNTAIVLMDFSLPDTRR